MNPVRITLEFYGEDDCQVGFRLLNKLLDDEARDGRVYVRHTVHKVSLFGPSLLTFTFDADLFEFMQKARDAGIADAPKLASGVALLPSGG